ncbi:MAG: bifunctional 5,10-methylenetetrahydrofolate dehydrogenase/5,10-methenyltetrahydrofolate cyclohydrolase [Sediminibacterium sp.]|nr:bifunctional 5,10-methylenetetrahydrofolate dehydrogenase/5,10-methenyltetrahydrofolate cyclohydrolase [Sediminibacterium sp.]
MIILDGKEVATHWKNKIQTEVNQYVLQGCRSPKLAIIKVGLNPASAIYVKRKMEACEQVGIETIFHSFEEISQTHLIELIESLNKTNDVDGILVQLPLPNSIAEHKIINKVSASKDVDGLHPLNIGYLASGQPQFVSATPLGITYLLNYYNLDLVNKSMVIIGRSNIVGRPLFHIFSAPPYNCTVTLAHSKTKNLSTISSAADILMVAIGKPQFIDESYIKPDAIIVDVGINRIHLAGKDKVVGDVDFERVKNLCSAITPVPGGVGLTTISALLHNTLKAYKNNISHARN